LGTGLTAGSHLSATGVKRKRGRGGAGPAGWRVGPTGPSARAREKEKASGLLACGLKEEKGREREGEGKMFLFFFVYILFNFFFKHSNFNQTKSMHWNHDAQALIISKLF
jgi:hypothetical protein